MDQRPGEITCGLSPQTNSRNLQSLLALADHSFMIASVDGCRGGWFVAQTEQWPTERPSFCFCSSFGEVLDVTQKCRITVVDMPIGLPSAEYPRPCDSEARNELEGAQSRLFFTPPRKAILRDTWETFQAEHRRSTKGIGASIQVWSILPKIREIDRAINAQLQKRIREFHPELTWKRLAERTLLSKHSAAGLLERVGVLEHRGVKWIRDVPHDTLPKNVALDDFLDAIVGLDAADRIARNTTPIERFPTTGGRTDQKGLRMEIWF